VVSKVIDRDDLPVRALHTARIAEVAPLSDQNWARVLNNGLIRLPSPRKVQCVQGNAISGMRRHFIDKVGP
jgi:hypothetical protein